MRTYRSFLFLLGYAGGIGLCAQPAQYRATNPLTGAVNRQLPSWLRFTGEERIRLENLTGVGFRDIGDLYALNRLRVHMEVRPSGWLRFHVEGQDARVFGQNALPAPASQKDAMDLRTGYVMVGSEEGPILLRAGRQPMTLGEGRLLADPNWSNVGRSFDAARLTVHAGDLKLDLFTGVVAKVDPVGFNGPAPGAHFHGAYGSITGMAPGATLEPYFLWRLEHGYKSEAGAPGHLDLKTLGLRWAGKLGKTLDYAADYSRQLGLSAGDPIRAWSARALLGYTLTSRRYRPRFYTEWNHASGDADARDGMRGCFDPLFPSGHDRLGLTDLFTWSNLVQWRTGLGLALQPKLTAGVSYSSSWLASASDWLYIGGKPLVRHADGSGGTHIGHQADVQAAWTASPATQLLAGYGRLFPGGFLQHTTAGVPYNIVFLSIAQRF